MHPIPSLPFLCLSGSTQQSGTAAGSFVNKASTCLDLATTTSLFPLHRRWGRMLSSYPSRYGSMVMLPWEYRSCCLLLLLYGCNIMNRFHSSQSGLTAPAGTWLVRSQEGAHCSSSRTRRRRIKLMGSSMYWALQSSSHLKCSPSLHFPEPFVAARNTKLNKVYRSSYKASLSGCKEEI